MNNIVFKEDIINPDIIKMIDLIGVYLNNKKKRVPINKQIKPKLEINAILGNIHSVNDVAGGKNFRQV